jgi:serine/threonine-protein kinase RsbW
LPVTTQSLTVAAELSCLPEVTEFVRKGALEARLPNTRIGELNLLIEEAMVNVCRHAYPDGQQGAMTVTYWVHGPGELSVDVADQGIEFNPLDAPAPNLKLDLVQRPIGGLGVFLLKKFSNSLTYRRQESWNHLTFSLSANP